MPPQEIRKITRKSLILQGNSPIRTHKLSNPGELTLHASVHSACVSERAMLMETLAALGPDEVLVLDRGDPAAWLVALLNARGIRFVMRCDSSSGWAASKRLVRSGALEAVVTLNAPSRKDVDDWACPAVAPQARLLRQVAPNGKVRVLATNLDTGTFPQDLFGDLYHQRWRIEEAFNRLKHRLHLEAVSGLSQQALIIDVAAKVLSDNLTSLMCQVTINTQDLPTRAAGHKRKCNRDAAHLAALLAARRRLGPNYSGCAAPARCNHPPLRPRSFSASTGSSSQTSSFMCLQGGTG